MTNDSTSQSTETRWLVSPSLIQHQYNSMSGQLKIYNFNTDSFNITKLAYCKASVYSRTIRYFTQTEYQPPSLIFTWPLSSQNTSHLGFLQHIMVSGVWIWPHLHLELKMLYLNTPYMPLVWFLGIKFWLLSVVIIANVSNSADFIISHELCGHFWKFWWRVHKRPLLYSSLRCV